MRAAGWPLVGWAAVIVGGMVTAILLKYGTNEEGFHEAVYWTARTSGLLFLLPLLASPAHRLWRSRTTGWVLRNRRYLGVSFALSHTIHLAAVFLFLRSTGESQPVAFLIVTGVAYAFLAAMVATSFDRTARWLGPTRWRRLHVSGLYYLWLVFAYTFGTHARDDVNSAVFATLLMAALPFRLWALRGRSSRTS